MKRVTHNNVKKLLLCFLVACCLFFVASSAEAVVLYLEPSSGQYQPGQTFFVEVKIDTEGQCINTIAANLSYDQDILNVLDFSSGQSIISLWLQPPEIDGIEGRISFAGGIPGGYCGKLPGDPGETDILGKIIVNMPGLLITEKEKDIVEIRFLEDSQVFLNDGLGTEAKLTLKGAEFEIVEGVSSLADDWEKEVLEDKIPPEPFEILVSKDPKIFEGKYFIIFQTVDKQTGLDYYEVKEGKKEWQLAQSPYLLENQELSYIIKVRAVDKAGNERTVEYAPSYRPLTKSPLFWAMIVLAGFGLGIGYLVYRKLKRKTRPPAGKVKNQKINP